MTDLEKATKIVLLLFSGLLPENLNEAEVKLMEDTYGIDWFDRFGYREPEFKRPRFESLPTKGMW